VAHALGLAALAQTSAPPAALGAANNDIVERVRDLLEPPRRHARAGIVLGVAMVLCWISSAAVVMYIHAVIELAEATV
jgi:hypothetical protein